MFKQLFSALTSETSIDQAYADLTQMLEHGAWTSGTYNVGPLGLLGRVELPPGVLFRQI